MDASIPSDNFQPAPVKSQSKLPVILVAYLILALAGSGTGYLLSRRVQSPSSSASASTQMIKTETEAGTLDTKTFKDFATGKLEAGGENGEGTHKLVRPGGKSQTVYLISSIVDLNNFVDKNVEVYGQTVRAKSVGWLMDVGRIKVID